MSKFKIKPSFWDYIGICLTVFLLAFLLVLASLNLSIFNPLKHALEDFKMTDVYFELLRSDKAKELNKDIVLVDITKLTNRDSIAQVIVDVNSCSPKVVMIDLIFERPSFDEVDDISLVNAIESGKDKEILSCKLTGYNPKTRAFTNETKSFFHEIADFRWGYSNVDQLRPGGCIRKYSLTQNLNDTVSYSMAYMASCAYMGVPLEKKDISQRLIVFDDTDFLDVPCDKVLENKKLLENKLVIIGTLEEEADMHITPVGKLPGMKVLAYSATTFMNHKEISSMSKWSSLVLAFLVCLFCAWAGHLLRERFASMSSYVLKLFYFMVTAILVWMAFITFVHFDYDVNLLYPLLGMALVEEGRLQYSALVTMLGKYTKWQFIKKSIYNKNK
jgi:CHASE2 domain-containing sensor protein